MTLLDMENKKSILSALNELGIAANRTPSPILEEYLCEIAKHGLTFIPWSHIKPLILQKFNLVMDEFIRDANSNSLQSAEVSDLRERVYKAINQFEGTPFTIQRICELLTEPRKNYTRPNKFLRGFEKACLIVSTIDCYGNKLYNVDPRLSGSIVKSSPIMNGCSTDCGSNSSVEDSFSGNKRSDEEDDDFDEDNGELTDPFISARRPCINFYRSLTDRRFSSKLIDSHQKPMKDNLVGSYSPGIPGKHTLQRPFLSGRTSSFRPISEESVDSSSGGDGFEERGDKEKDEAMIEDGIAEEEAMRTDPIKPTVPPIDQMLRPMGQLEAFVNTISMATSAPSSVTTTAVTVSAELHKCCTETEEEKLADVVSASAVIKMSNAEVKLDDEPQASALPVEDEAEETVSADPRPSLKRESLTCNENNVKAQPEDGSTELMASPAKRIRTDDKEDEDDGNQGESHSANVEPLSTEVREVEHTPDESVLKQMIEKGNE